MGESRTELLAWVNDLLQLNYTKVEQTGTGTVFKKETPQKVLKSVCRCCLLSDYGFSV